MVYRQVANGRQASAAAQVVPEDFGLLLSAYDEVTYEREMEPVMEAPVREGDVAGYDRYYVNGELYRVFPICISERVDRISYRYCLSEIVKKYFFL